MKKRFFTLLEVIIGLLLAAILLSFSFRFFSELVKMEKKMYKASEDVLFKNSLNIKLSSIFSEISTIDTFKKDFYTKNESLYFVFDAGVDRDPLFSSFLLGNIYLKDNSLILETHGIVPPIDASKPKKLKSKKIRKEILAKNIKELSFEFLEKNKDTKKIQSSSVWEKKEYLPLILKIKLKTEEETLLFTFFLQKENCITYESL